MSNELSFAREQYVLRLFDGKPVAAVPKNTASPQAMLVWPAAGTKRMERLDSTRE